MVLYFIKMTNLFEGRDLISIRDLSSRDIKTIIKCSYEMEKKVQKGKKLSVLNGIIVSMLFFEPSTRTRLSFESAVLRLGGNCIGFSEPNTSSTAKGETLADTIRTVENYSDMIVIRHPLEGSAKLAAEMAEIPVINAGDGSNQHPTQTLLDMYTIEREADGVKNKKIGFLGDLKHARTVHSLIYALSMFDTELYMISPDELKLPRGLLEEVKDSVPVREGSSLSEFIEVLDVLYVTRIQRERFADEEEYNRVRGAYKVTPDTIKNSKENLIIMHPLPRVDEISHAIDKTKHAVYFKQVYYGIPVRMAILSLLAGRYNG